MDVFAWSYKDIPDIGQNITKHKIALYLDAKPVKLKLQRMRQERTLKIKEEVWKQLDVGFIKVTHCPQ